MSPPLDSGLPSPKIRLTREGMEWRELHWKREGRGWRPASVTRHQGSDFTTALNAL